MVVRLTGRRFGLSFDAKCRYAPTTAHEDDVEQDIAPRTEEVTFFTAVDVGKEEG
jgi:hypothetical protein